MTASKICSLSRRRSDHGSVIAWQGGINTPIIKQVCMTKPQLRDLDRTSVLRAFTTRHLKRGLLSARRNVVSHRQASHGKNFAFLPNQISPKRSSTEITSCFVTFVL